MNPPFARNVAGMDDPTTAVRHLAAARNCSSARCKARVWRSMPGLRGLCQTRHLDRGCLLVIDKRAGPKSTTVINRATVADLVPSSRRFHRAVGSQLNCRSWPRFRLPNHAHLAGRIPSAAPKLAAANCTSDATDAIPLAYTVATPSPMPNRRSASMSPIGRSA
jgi:hypothetical protein